MRRSCSTAASSGGSGYRAGLGAPAEFVAVTLNSLFDLCCVLFAGRRPEAATFLAGTVVGLCYGVASGYLLARPFVDTAGETTALGETP